MKNTVYLIIFGEPLSYYREDYLDEMRPIEDTWEDQLTENIETAGIDFSSLKGERIA